MAEEERAPLLSSEISNAAVRNRNHAHLFPTPSVRSNAVCADDRIFVNATVTSPSEIEPDVIVAIFVVAFDTRSGERFVRLYFHIRHMCLSIDRFVLILHRR